MDDTQKQTAQKNPDGPQDTANLKHPKWLEQPALLGGFQPLQEGLHPSCVLGWRKRQRHVWTARVRLQAWAKARAVLRSGRGRCQEAIIAAVIRKQLGFLGFAQKSVGGFYIQYQVREEQSLTLTF
jgi:hypothetical protein